MPASRKLRMIAGPESPIASPRITKMPVPMIAPMPSAVRSSSPTARRSWPASTSVSATSRSTGFVANRAPAIRCLLLPLGDRSRHDQHGPARALHELERHIPEHPARNPAASRGADDDQVGVLLLGVEQDAGHALAGADVGGRLDPLAGEPLGDLLRAAARLLLVLAARQRRQRLHLDAVDADHLGLRTRLQRQLGGGVGQPRLAHARLGRDHDRLHVPSIPAFACRSARTYVPSAGRSIVSGVPPFKLDSVYSPAADQPAAITSLAEGIEAGERALTLLGATGTGKTMTMAATIEAVQRPSLVIAHNKTLAAQLCNEFRTYFPHNSVEYFVSYYDYYQPEAYVPSKDLYIEKDSAINQEIDRLRHAATASLFARRDVIIVASVSCIFGLGSPETYNDNCQVIVKGSYIDRDELLRKLVHLQYNRNDTALGRGTFRVRGETLEVFPAYEETAFRVLLFGDEVERLQHFDPLTGEIIRDDIEHVAIWPATHYNVKEGTMERAVVEIGAELNERCAELEAEGKLLEAHRLRQRTQYDMEMLKEVGFCSGIENYSRILDGREPGSRPYCLLDYFPKDFVCFIDESHQTVPQIGGMYEGDRSRKKTLVEYGFRLPSAMDNRPQTFDEWLSITPQM